MLITPPTLRGDAIAIWRAGVNSVRAETLMQAAVRREVESLVICGERLLIGDIGRIAVVGAGKAGAGMAAGFEDSIGSDLLDRVTGWVNVPDDCVRPLARIHLHSARPAGVNEPTEAGVEGADRILELVGSLALEDVCIVLLSGGGSALLPAPIVGVSLADKQVITRGLSQAGASIGELNCIRKHLSRIKGGRLAAACTAGRLIALIISDVIGDPLDVIASGPTIADSTTADDARAVLQKYADRLTVPPSIKQALSPSQVGKQSGRVRSAAYGSAKTEPIATDNPQLAVHNQIIGNIDVALHAAAEEARCRGYTVQSLGGANAGIAREVGVDLAERCLTLRDIGNGPTCLLSGGEPTVEVVPTPLPRMGGRNQELILAAADRLWDEDATRLAILSGGTDGEDGPTNAAGAILDADSLNRAKSLGLDPTEFLAINDSYPFFAETDAHLITGPTHTNVMDLRVAVIR